jgi:hypothetical protein
MLAVAFHPAAAAGFGQAAEIVAALMHVADLLGAPSEAVVAEIRATARLLGEDGQPSRSRMVH